MRLAKLHRSRQSVNSAQQKINPLCKITACPARIQIPGCLPPSSAFLFFFFFLHSLHKSYSTLFIITFICYLLCYLLLSIIYLLCYLLPSTAIYLPSPLLSIAIYYYLLPSTIPSTLPSTTIYCHLLHHLLLSTAIYLLFIFFTAIYCHLFAIFVFLFFLPQHGKMP